MGNSKAAMGAVGKRPFCSKQNLPEAPGMAMLHALLINIWQ
jgi:hypothetical protein